MPWPGPARFRMIQRGPRGLGHACDRDARDLRVRARALLCAVDMAAPGPRSGSRRSGRAQSAAASARARFFNGFTRARLRASAQGAIVSLPDQSARPLTQTPGAFLAAPFAPSSAFAAAAACVGAIAGRAPDHMRNVPHSLSARRRCRPRCRHRIHVSGAGPTRRSGVLRQHQAGNCVILSRSRAATRPRPERRP